MKKLAARPAYTKLKIRTLIGIGVFVFALLFNLFSLPLWMGPVSATTVQSAKDTMTRHKISTLSSHTIVFQLSASETFATGETVIYDFNDDGAADFDVLTMVVGDLDFNDGTERTIVDVDGDCATHAGGDDVVASFSATTGIITIEACGSMDASASGATLTLEVGVAAGGSDVITNPGTIGSKEINMSGTFGDDVFEIDVPIMDDDQVTVSAVVGSFILFDLDIENKEPHTIGSDHADSDDPYAIDLQELTFSSITDEDTTSVSEIYVDITSNADGGTVIQVLSANGATGLSSASSGDNIPSATATLATDSLNGGYGLAADEQATATTGTLTEISPFNVFGVTGGVGGLTTSFQTIFNTGGAPIRAGDGVVAVRSVAGTSTSAADDYTDTLTFRATGTF